MTLDDIYNIYKGQEQFIYFSILEPDQIKD